MSAPRPYVTNPFHPVGSICTIASFPYICQRFPVTSSKWYVKVYHDTVGIQNLRMCFSKTPSLRLKTINQITWTSILQVLTRIDTKRMDSLLARLLGKNGEIGRYRVPRYQSLWGFSLCLSVSRKQN